MSRKISRLAVAILVAIPSLAQKPAEPTVDRTFHFTTGPSARDLQEIATVLRTVAQIRTLSVDAAAPSISVSGNSGDIALADWTIQALDQPARPLAPEKQIRDSAVHEYRVPGAKDDVVRMFYLTDINTPQSMQELLTVLRTVGAIQRVFNYTTPLALAVRGTTAQIALSTWIISELDQPSTGQTEGIHQFESGDANFPVVRAFYLAHRSPKDIQDTLSALRATVHIQRAFSHTARAVVIIAGSPGQVEDAARMVAARDRGVTP